MAIIQLIALIIACSICSVVIGAACLVWMVRLFGKRIEDVDG